MNRRALLLKESPVGKLDIETHVGIDDEISLEMLLSQRELRRFIGYGEAVVGVPLRLLDLDEQLIIGDPSGPQDCISA